MSKKIALIVWAAWQDGTILMELLKTRKYSIIALSRHWVEYINLDPWERYIDILKNEDVHDVIERYTPDELYYIAAYHHSSEEKISDDRALYIQSRNIHCDWYFNFLSAVAESSPHTRIWYASSGLIYGGSTTEKQNENTLPVPNSPYAITKLEGMHLGNWYAEKYHISVANAIFYNHESEFRGPKFLSMKVILAALAISQWRQNELILGDIDTKIDQWSAWDYVDAMTCLLSQNKTGDYIVSSWEQHTIEDMLKIVFGYFHLDWKKYVKVDPNIVQRKTGTLLWDNTKIYEATWWKPKQSFSEMLIHIIQKKAMSL